MDDPHPDEPFRWQFSIRTLLLLMLLAAVLSGIARTWPHVSLFLAGVLPAPYFTFHVVRRLVQQRRVGKMFIVATLLGWFTCYAAFAGPVAYWVWKGTIPRQTAVTIYAPFVWLQTNTSLRDTIEWYRDKWQTM